MKKIFNRALFFLKFRPRSEKEIKDYLKKYLTKLKLTPSDQDILTKNTISRLKELKFIDDREFIRFWLERRMRRNPKAEKVIRYELKQKGVSEDLIQEVFAREISKFSTTAALQNLLKKAKQRYKYLPSVKKEQKIIGYLLRRGYTFSEIRRLTKLPERE